jgi:acyl-coenzyme A synthetase/AMP-(fatty) acid ligase/acyl carrier protein
LVHDVSKQEKLNSLRTIIVGGEEITPSTTHTFLAQFPAVRIINLYGPTEASIGCICYEVTDKKNGRIPIGKPIANVHALILDKNKNLVPAGVAGELYLSGMCLGLGYLNDKEKTNAAFVDNPFPEIPWDKLYKTGDLVRYLPDGNIDFLGRLDHQIKLRGFRIELGEIETILSQHPAVMETVVIAQEDGTGDKRLVAYATLKPGQTLDANAARSFSKEKLPSYMVPAEFVFLDRLPLTINGKIDRKALRPPDQSRPELRQLYVAHRNPVEEMITEIWGEVLKLDQIGVHDNFFELGGHSLLATQVMSRMRKVFQVELPLRSLFEMPTVAQLANEIEVTKKSYGEMPRPEIPSIPRQPRPPAHRY